MGTSGGEVIVTRTDGAPVTRFNAHKGLVAREMRDDVMG